MGKLILPQFYSTRGDIFNFMHAKCASNGSVFSKIDVLNTSNDDIKTCMNIYRLTQPPILTCKVFLYYGCSKDTHSNNSLIGYPVNTGFTI